MPDTSAPLQEALAFLANRRSLSERLTAQVFGVVMRGEATPAQVAALLMGLRVKGETPDEVAGAARALREAMVRVDAAGPHLVDTCGTGGGAVGTFNISTAAAFVAAGAGATVAKHGNRSFTSKCGSADVLEALGVTIALDAGAAARVLREACVTFLFAPNFHPAMKHVGPAQYGYAIADAGALAGGEPANNAARVEALLAGGGNDAAGRAAVMLNAGAAVYVAGLASTYVEGIKRAADAISRGLALRALERLRQASAGASASTSG